MESLGEVGKKMRSAIKAKLVELGNASQSGYIDDELPDYVMIMVANKRSKQQMLNDLNLFLGSKTEEFVAWLHQVLQKLQEVTLPTTLASKAKKKVSESSSKKDKKKDKKKSSKEPSITDVIAVELIEKAKKTIDPKVKDEKTPSPPPAPEIMMNHDEPPTPPRISSSTANRDDFDIPTLSEITTTAGTVLHRKELSHLEQIQNKIYEHKRKLRPAYKESSDEHMSPVRRSKTPEAEKRSVKDRLGVKPTENSKPSNIISLSAIRKAENELHANSTIRKLVERQKEENERKNEGSRSNRKPIHERIDSYRSRRERRSRSTSRDRYRNRERVRRRSRSRSPMRSQERRSRPSIRQRFGGRLSASKSSRSPEAVGKIKLKIRPTLSSAITAHAGKNLLLRAVAEAQRSTAQASSDSKRKQRDHIVVKVPNCNDKRSIQYDEEYIPESISAQSESEAEYHPSHRNVPESMEDDGDVVYLNNNDVDLDDLEDNNDATIQQKSTEFIVTAKVNNFEEDSKSSHSPTPPPVIKRKSIKDRIGPFKVELREESAATKRRYQEDEEECESQRAYNKVKRTRVSPIMFDLTDDENNDHGKSRSSSRDRSEKKTPTKNNDKEHNGEENVKRIRLEASRSFDHVPALLSSIAVPVTEASKPVVKSKERCKYYPACSNSTCAFYHPTLPCKAFPLCKFGDTCAYVHPRCKFDVSCNRIECNFTHTPILAQSSPIVASSVVPAQNYKSVTITPNSTICKFFPNCTNTNCIFMHPKICKFGKGCMNKFDCNFYHFETSSKSKFKWVSPLSF